MFRVLCCGDTKTSTVFRISISQLVLYGVFITLYVCGAVLINDEPDEDDYEDDDDKPIIADRVFIIAAILNVIPLVLAAILYIGLITKKYYYLRIYIFAKIFETIINTLILLGFAIYYALEVQLYFAVLLCAFPVVIGIWMLECVVVVNVFYTSKVTLPAKNPFRNPSTMPAIQEEI